MGSVPVWSYCKCVFCDRFFEVYRFKGDRARRYCSKSCANKYSYHGGKREMSQCAVCEADLDRVGKRYCSAACRQKAYRVRRDG